jgi:Flp pilus assembly protein TadG
MLAKQNQNTKTQARRKRQGGAALLETALVFSVGFSMIVFIINMGQILLTQQFISERARVGVRSAVVNNWNATAVANYVAYGTTTTPAGGTGASGLMGLTANEVRLTTYADSGIGDARYQVTVSGVPLFSWIPYMAGKYTAPTIIVTAPVQSGGATN